MHWVKILVTVSTISELLRYRMDTSGKSANTPSIRGMSLLYLSAHCLGNRL